MRRKTIGFISCGTKKNVFMCKAKDMYIGSYFNSCKKVAELRCDVYYIVSAKYGILTPETVIGPYDVYLRDFKKLELEKFKVCLKKQIRLLGINEQDKIIILCGQNYGKLIKEILCNNKFYEPLVGVGMNAQKGLLKKLLQ